MTTGQILLAIFGAYLLLMFMIGGCWVRACNVRERNRVAAERREQRLHGNSR